MRVPAGHVAAPHAAGRGSRTDGSTANAWAACTCSGSASGMHSGAPPKAVSVPGSWAARMIIMNSSYEPTSPTAGHAVTAATRQAVLETVSDVRRKRRCDAQPQQPTRQRWNRRLPSRAVRHHHRARVDQPVHLQRHQPGRPSRLAVRPHEIIGVLVRCATAATTATPMTATAVVHLIT